MRFLIARLSSLGDVVCCLPAATILRSAFPESRIIWAVDPRFAGIVECCSAVDEVVRVKPRITPSTWPKFPGDFDAVLDLQGLSKSAIVVARAKSKLKLGYHWQREGAWLFSHPVRPEPTSIHIVHQYVDVARAAVASLGGNLTDRADFAMKPHAEDTDTIQTMLSDLDVAGPYVLLNPGAGWVSKRWPARAFAAVADWLWGQGLTPVALGGNAPADHAAYDEVAAHSQRPPIKMTGKTSVRELVTLVANAQAHVGGDTGSSHLAAALGVPCIGLYSITRPERSCPYGQIANCHYNPAGLDRITPESVIEQLSKLVKARS